MPLINEMVLAGFSSGESQGSSAEPLLKEFTPCEALEEKKKIQVNGI